MDSDLSSIEEEKSNADTYSMCSERLVREEWETTLDHFNSPDSTLPGRPRAESVSQQQCHICFQRFGNLRNRRQWCQFCKKATCQQHSRGRRRLTNGTEARIWDVCDSETVYKQVQADIEFEQHKLHQEQRKSIQSFEFVMEKSKKQDKEIHKLLEQIDKVNTRCLDKELSIKKAIKRRRKETERMITENVSLNATIKKKRHA